MIQPATGGDLAQYLSDYANSTPQTATKSSGTHLNFLGWGVLLLSLYALNGTSWGHEVIYYSMVLIVLYLFVVNYNKIMPVLTKN